MMPKICPFPDEKKNYNLGWSPKLKTSENTLESSEAGSHWADFIRCFTSCSQDYPQILWINKFRYHKN
ncbi:hypothetical protein A6J39_006995 [Legionella anisa]|uniref:Uncharacterized protein n=1 Tax=Legionella anisa TaxID=28082 RepID=A0AAX0WSB2_9GAMM|nr:hypothetical protein DLD14_15145 [Legionella anisa]PNL60980.1 hypothetical protein A6J39_006995 [Legionella anisa]